MPDGNDETTADQIKTDQAKDPEIAKLEAEKAKFEAEAARHKADKARIDADKARIEADEARHDAEMALKLKQITSETELNTKLAESEKDLADKRQEAFLAKYIGTTTPGSYQGTVTAKDGVGKTEAALLASAALRKCADKIAASAKKASNGAVDFSIFDAKTFPDFVTLRGFRFQISLIEKRFGAAGVSAEKREPAAARAAAMVALPATISAGLTAVSDILGYLKTDYTVGDVNVELDDSMLVFCAAGALKKQGADVTLPLVYQSDPDGAAMKELAAEFEKLELMRMQTSLEVQKVEGKIKSLTDAGVAENANEIAGLNQDLAKLNTALKSYDDFINSLNSASGDGNQLQTIMKELAVEQACKSRHVLLVRLESSGGGYIIKKNLLTGLGKMPLYYSGGASASYALFEGNSGKVLGGDVVQAHGGCVNATRLASALNKP